MFYRVVDNSGFVKVNHISDDAEAMRINEAGRAEGYPPCTSPMFMGGYTFPILNDVAQGRTYQVLKAALPEDSSPMTARFVQRLINEPETIYSYVDGPSITIVQIDGFDREREPMSRSGWRFTAGPKTFKRLKTLNRPFRLWNKLTRPLRVLVVDDDAYSNMKQTELDEVGTAEVEKLLDGAFVISRELFEDCLSNIHFPQFSPDDMRPELMVNFYRSTAYLQQAQYFHAFNARIFGQMEFTNLKADDPLYSRPGMLKGEAFICIDDRCRDLGVDVICTRSALKFEVASKQDGWVLLEPQKAKRSGVNSDLQTMIDLPALYQYDDVKDWCKEFLLSNFEALKNDKIMESWFDMSVPMFNSSKFFDQNDVTNLTKWNVRAWLLSGLKITSSPWLFEQMGSAIAKTLKSANPNKLRFPVPCAARAQVISQSMASMIGVEFQIIEGSARWSDECEAVVVNDKDWLEMYLSHGGQDLDDFFVIYWRTINNARKMVVVRSPNDWGEYSIFDYIEGDWFPTFEGHKGNTIMFPIVSGDASLWATRLSEVVLSGGIHYTGLPSEHDETPKPEPHPYGAADVMNLVSNNRASASCVGANVNARGLWTLATSKHRPVQLTSMENCIDTGTQGGSAEDASAVMSEAKDMVQQLILTPSVKISEYMWFTRFQQIFGMPFPRERLTDQTHVDKAHKFRMSAERDFMQMVRQHAQSALTNNIDPQVHRLGKRMIRTAAATLIDTRFMMVKMQNPGQQELIPGDWNDVHSLVLEKILTFGNEELMPGTTIIDRHDFVLGLYSACFKLPTSGGRVTDQIVMNPHVFPYLLEAMRFYGLARYLHVSEEGKFLATYIKEWELPCAECGDSPTVDDPLILQAYHHYRQICKKCGGRA